MLTFERLFLIPDYASEYRGTFLPGLQQVIVGQVRRLGPTELEAVEFSGYPL